MLGREYLDSSEDGMFLDSSRSASLLHLQTDNLLLELNRLAHGGSEIK